MFSSLVVRLLSDEGGACFFIKIPRQCGIRVGGLSKIEFKRGFHAYIGSALSGVIPRIKMHLKIEKKFCWHIEYQLCYTEVSHVYCRQGNGEKLQTS